MWMIFSISARTIQHSFDDKSIMVSYMKSYQERYTTQIYFSGFTYRSSYDLLKRILRSNMM